MTEKSGKYAAAPAAIVQSDDPKTHIALPMKPQPPRGKRSTAGWKQKAVLLKEASIEEAKFRLRRRGDRTDFSDLMHALLEAWLAAPE